jgi:hypothetical protein
MLRGVALRNRYEEASKEDAKPDYCKSHGQLNSAQKRTSCRIHP